MARLQIIIEIDRDPIKDDPNTIARELTVDGIEWLSGTVALFTGKAPPRVESAEWL